MEREFLLIVSFIGSKVGTGQMRGELAHGIMTHATFAGPVSGPDEYLRELRATVSRLKRDLRLVRADLYVEFSGLATKRGR